MTMLIGRWSTLAMPRSAQFNAMRDQLLDSAIPLRLERDGLDRRAGFVAHAELHGFPGEVAMVRSVGQAARGLRGRREIARAAPDCLWAIRYRHTSGHITLNGRDYEVGPGDIVYGDCGVELIASGGPFVDYDQWVFPTALVRDLLAVPEGNPVGVLRRATPLGRMASDHLGNLAAVLAVLPADQGLGMVRHLATLIALDRGLSPHAGEAAEQSIADLRLLAIIRDIERHHADPALSPRLLARRHGLSERALQRLFEASGKSCARVLLETRLAAAHGLLSSPRAGRIADIAFACGFESLSSFYRNFRAHFGHPPGDLL